MNVLLVSECDHRALIETRRILDQFAERRGERCWQTPITQAGLDALHTLLRKSARKNTAVACHWLRGERPQLLWVVGDKRRFNAGGAVPIHRTARNIRRAEDENPMKDGLLLRALVDLAGLLHDLGKATQSFQDKLRGRSEPGRNVLRHEWVSLRLWQAFVGSDDDAQWLTRLAAPSAADDQAWQDRLSRDGTGATAQPPFLALQAAPLAQALGWLVVTHHRLPTLGERDRRDKAMQRDLVNVLANVTPSWNEFNFFHAPDEGGEPQQRSAAEFEPLWRFANDAAPYLHPGWRKRAARCARTLLRLHEQGRLPASPLAEPYLMHSARLCLMLADHRYSSLQGKAPERLTLAQASGLWANTQTKSKKPACNQSLDEHLQGVATLGAQLAHALPRGLANLPALGRVPALDKRSTAERFRWQDRSADLAASARLDAALHGAFIVNLASTGCGKTLANARVMQALADPERGMRCAFALGLRSLTLQTGRAFQERLRLHDSKLAVMAGGSAQRTLFELACDERAEASGSASSQALLDEHDAVEYDAPVDRHPLLRHALSDDKSRRLLQAPVLVCTVDHLTPATESERGGRQIAPMLRLMSGDLVMDEIDDFDLADLPALARLVHWAGLLGARVLISSATLTPDLVQALFEAWRAGRLQYQAQHPAARPPGHACLWLDEFAQTRTACADGATFRAAHEQFASARVARLAEVAAQAPRRRLLHWPLGARPAKRQDCIETFAARALAAALHLHEAHHSPDPVSGQAVSFGLLRMANIQRLIEVALALHQRGSAVRVHLCAYHSRHTLVVRAAIERLLDAVLQRHDPATPFAHPAVRAAIDAEPGVAHCFVVLASPVAEVGRDHDYDWAVVEPSSMRSLVQLAGRVRRHRDGAIQQPNVAVLSSNLRAWLQPGEPAYCWPGFEGKDNRFTTAELPTLLPWPDGTPIDSQPRLLAPTRPQPADRLADLEHTRLRAELLAPTMAAPLNPRRPAPPKALHATDWWTASPRDAFTTALLPRAQPFRRGNPTTELLLKTDDAGREVEVFRVRDEGRGREVEERLETGLLHRLPDAQLPQDRGVMSWGVPDYLPTLKALAAALGRPLPTCANQFGRVSVPPQTRAKHGWAWHPSLGYWTALAD